VGQAYGALFGRIVRKEGWQDCDSSERQLAQTIEAEADRIGHMVVDVECSTAEGTEDRRVAMAASPPRVSTSGNSLVAKAGQSCMI
jgi:hypothetical protein